jgi:hypothetical protein
MSDIPQRPAAARADAVGWLRPNVAFGRELGDQRRKIHAGMHGERE